MIKFKHQSMNKVIFTKNLYNKMHKNNLLQIKKILIKYNCKEVKDKNQGKM